MSTTIKHQLDIPEVFKVYENEKNFEILEGDPSKSRDCYVFFSSHGIYFPNTSEEFRAKILEGNRFEWKRNIPQNYAKVIFLRDVFKQWYLEGINSEINSVEKLVDFLKQETQGFKAICVGSSAGGYAATLFGSLLNAEKVYNFSGQFSLWHYWENQKELNPILVKHASNPAVNQYFDIVDFVKASNTPIFYFYPAKSEEDIIQSQLVRGVRNIYDFRFNDCTHGCTVMAISLTDLFELSTNAAIDLHRKMKNELLNAWAFSFRVSGIGKTISYLAKKFYKTLKKKLNRN